MKRSAEEANLSDPAAKVQVTGKEKIILSYWNGRGLAEIARTMLAISGAVWENDLRSAMPGPDEQQNLGRLPLVKIGDVVIGQSDPIMRLVARRIGWMGDNDFDAAYIEMICAHVKDMKEAFRKLYPYSEEPVAGWEAAWFDKPAEAKERKDRALKWFLSRIETQVGKDGYVLNGKFSLADAVLYNTLGEVCKNLTEKDYMGKVNTWRYHPFHADSYERTRAVMEEVAPSILKIVENYRDHPEMQKYLKNRDAQKPLGF